MLYQSILEAASGGDKRPVMTAGELDAAQHTVKAGVGAAGRCPQGVVAGKNFLGCGSGQRSCRQPVGFDGNTQRERRVLQRSVNGNMAGECRVEIAEDADANGLVHIHPQRGILN
jgi:hypothetical protein